MISNNDQKSKKLPLAGLRFLLTRGDNENRSISKMLKSKGASVLVIPMHKIVSPGSWEFFDQIVLEAQKIDWAI